MKEDQYEEIRKGMSLIWNNKFDEADELFGGKKETSPRYALHYAESVFLRSFITADIGDTQAAVERLKYARNFAEKQIASYEKGIIPGTEPPQKGDQKEILPKLIDLRLVVGDSLYMTAILQMTRDSKLKGAFNLRKSWKVFEKALRESKSVENFEDELQRSLEFGAGFFLFAISIIPPKFLKLVELVGFKADRDGGLQFIRQCHDGDGMREAFATMILLVNNLLLPRGVADITAYLKDADELIDKALKKYPDGSLFHVMASHCARKQCNIPKGIEMMEIALDNSKHFKNPPLIYRYELANCYCMELEWEKAVNLFVPLIEETKFQVRCICAVQAGACYIMLGQKEKAFELFARMPSLITSKSQLDSTVTRMGKRYLQNGGYFSAFELLYLRRDLAKMVPITEKVLRSLDEMASHTRAMEKIEVTPDMKRNTGKLGKFSSSFKSLTPFGKKKETTQDTSVDDRASYLLLRGSLLKSLGKNDEAMEAFREVADELADYITEKLFIPFCLYELGESYYRAGKSQEAEEMMKRCSKFSGYDWEEPLRIRLRVTMDQLKKGTKAAQPVSLDSLMLSSNSSVDDMVEPLSDDEEGVE